MPRTTINAINRVFVAEGLPVELVKGDGYFYLVYDAPPVYETEMVFTCYLSDYTKAEWLDMGRVFFKTFQ